MKPWALALLLAGGVGVAIALSRSAKAAPLPHGTILLLGDSLTGNDLKEFGATKGTLGWNLKELIEKSGRPVLVNALGARSAISFMKGSTQKGKEPGKGAEQLQDAIDHGIDGAIILLGTNDLAGLAVGNSMEYTMAPFRQMVKQLRDAGVEVYGIGAPHYQEKPTYWPYEEAFKKELQDLYGEDHFIDAGPLTENYKMHAGGSAARNFAQRLFDALEGK